MLGANGQDGTFLCKLLQDRVSNVSGVGRQEKLRYEAIAGPVAYHALDLRDQGELAALLRDVRANRIYHFAAVHQSTEGGGLETAFEDLWSVNVVSVQTSLEYIRSSNPACRLIYGSSGRVFGAPLPADIDEGTAHKGGDLYGESKIAASRLIDYYRRVHGVEASVVHLFNHESLLRPEDFFIPRLVEALRQAITKEGTSHLRTLDFWCDWGSAEEYMDIVLAMLEAAPGEDFVLASGRTVLARSLADSLFRSHGLDHRDFLVTSGSWSPAEPYSVSIGKCRRLVGRVPVVTIEEVCVEALKASGC